MHVVGQSDDGGPSPLHSARASASARAEDTTAESFGAASGDESSAATRDDGASGLHNEQSALYTGQTTVPPYGCITTAFATQMSDA